MCGSERPHCDLSARYERILERAQAWMELTQYSQSQLAEFLSSKEHRVERSLLSRFLSGATGYKPTPRAKRLVLILKSLENLLDRDGFAVSLLDPKPDEERGDFQWFFRHAGDLAKLHRVGPVYAHKQLPCYFSQAKHGPREVRYAMCANHMLCSMVIVEKVGDRGLASIPSAALRTIRDHVLQLEDVALTVAEESGYEGVVHRAIGYAAGTLAWTGLCLEDDHAVRRGVERLLEAARHSHEVQDGHWENTLRVLSKLLGLQHPDAIDLSLLAAEQALSDSSRSLQFALGNANFAKVKELWQRYGFLDAA